MLHFQTKYSLEDFKLLLYLGNIILYFVLLLCVPGSYER